MSTAMQEAKLLDDAVVEIEALQKELAVRDEVIEELSRCSGRVIYQATEASLQMPHNKIVSMANSDLEKLRALGLAVHELNRALASAKAKLNKGE